MISGKFCYKKSCGFTYGETVYIVSKTDVFYADIFLLSITWE